MAPLTDKLTVKRGLLLSVLDFACTLGLSEHLLHFNNNTIPGSPVHGQDCDARFFTNVRYQAAALSTAPSAAAASPVSCFRARPNREAAVTLDTHGVADSWPSMDRQGCLNVFEFQRFT